MSHRTSDRAVDVLQASFPQASARPWRGGEGAEAQAVVLGNGATAHIQLYFSGAMWFASAKFDGQTYEETASSAGEAARKLAKLLRTL